MTTGRRLPASERVTPKMTRHRQQFPHGARERVQLFEFACSPDRDVHPKPDCDNRLLREAEVVTGPWRPTPFRAECPS